MIKIHYQAIIPAPFGAVGIIMHDDKLMGIDLMPANHAINPNLLSLQSDSSVDVVCKQINDYVERPQHTFSLAVKLTGTPFQQKIWQAIQAIPVGETRTYGELAKSLGTGARAVANACGANKIPLVIPCHRVVSKSGLGGFMQGKHPDFIAIKAWLIRHEARRS